MSCVSHDKTDDISIHNVSYTQNSHQELRANVIRMKKADPNMRFRIELNRPLMETLTTSQVQEQGLEMPETHFVELSVYRQDFKEPAPEDIVSEVINGQTVWGVTRPTLCIRFCFWWGDHFLKKLYCSSVVVI